MKSQPFFEKFFHPKRTSPIFLSEKSFLRTRFLSIFRKNIKITSKLLTLFQKAYSLSARLFLQFFSFSSPLAPPKPSGKTNFREKRRSALVVLLEGAIVDFRFENFFPALFSPPEYDCRYIRSNSAGIDDTAPTARSSAYIPLFS